MSTEVLPTPELKKAKKVYYYAVPFGRSIGVFDNWPEAKASVHSFSCAYVKKFKTYQEALWCLHDHWTDISPGPDGIPSRQHTLADLQSIFKRLLLSKPSKKGESWYAVARGHHTGVFDSIDEVRQEVNGFSKAIFKKFIRRSKAQKWLKKQLRAEWLVSNGLPPDSPTNSASSTDSDIPSLCDSDSQNSD